MNEQNRYLYDNPSYWIKFMRKQNKYLVWATVLNIVLVNITTPFLTCAFIKEHRANRRKIAELQSQIQK